MNFGQIWGWKAQQELRILRKLQKIRELPKIAIFVKFVAEQNIVKIVVAFDPGHKCKTLPHLKQAKTLVGWPGIGTNACNTPPRSNVSSSFSFYLGRLTVTKGLWRTGAAAWAEVSTMPGLKLSSLHVELKHRREPRMPVLSQLHSPSEGAAWLWVAEALWPQEHTCTAAWKHQSLWHNLRKHHTASSCRCC